MAANPEVDAELQLRIGKWVGLLGSKEEAERDLAVNQLVQIGEPAVPSVMAFLDANRPRVSAHSNALDCLYESMFGRPYRQRAMKVDRTHEAASVVLAHISTDRCLNRLCRYIDEVVEVDELRRRREVLTKLPRLCFLVVWGICVTKLVRYQLSDDSFYVLAGPIFTGTLFCGYGLAKQPLVENTAIPLIELGNFRVLAKMLGREPSGMHSEFKKRLLERFYELLPSAVEGDAAYLSPGAVSTIHLALRVDAYGHFVNRSAGFSVLRSVGVLGNVETLSALHSLRILAKDPEIKLPLEHAIDALTEKLSRQHVGATLLRPADAPVDQSLLRPAANVESETANLLRPAGGAV